MTFSKRGRMGDQDLKDAAHNCLKTLTDGAACAAYKAGSRHSGTVNTALHDAHHALVRAGAACDGDPDHKRTVSRADRLAKSIGQPGAFEIEDKHAAARAYRLAKSLHQPVPIPSASRFHWDVQGARMGLDEIERTAEQARINRYRATQGLVPLS
jgi:hypothetical protein